MKKKIPAHDVTTLKLYASIPRNFFKNAQYVWTMKRPHDRPFKEGSVRYFASSLTFVDIPFYLVSGLEYDLIFSFVDADRTESIACASLPVIVWKA